jgi:DNA excision repair protein ERCC-4
MYSESIEEHQYLSALKREKKAFEDLILKKATLVISLPDFVEPERETAEGEEGAGEGMVLSDSRLRRVSEKMKLSSVIVVDIREFGSSLPSSLHLHGIDIQPVTLAVGDYILAPQICVERKGISDLFQSFNSGRLFSQAESMMRHYELMCLLIEFSPQRPFCLQSTNEIPSEIQVQDLCPPISSLPLSLSHSLCRSTTSAPRSLSSLSPFLHFQSFGQGKTSLCPHLLTLRSSSDLLTRPLTSSALSKRTLTILTWLAVWP